MELSAPALYRYFASRDDLVTALIVHAFNDLADFIQAAEAAVEAETYRPKILASYRAYRTDSLAVHHGQHNSANATHSPGRSATCTARRTAPACASAASAASTSPPVHPVSCARSLACAAPTERR